MVAVHDMKWDLIVIMWVYLFRYIPGLFHNSVVSVEYISYYPTQVENGLSLASVGVNRVLESQLIVPGTISVSPTHNGGIHYLAGTNHHH